MGSWFEHHGGRITTFLLTITCAKALAKFPFQIARVIPPGAPLYTRAAHHLANVLQAGQQLCHTRPQLWQTCRLLMRKASVCCTAGTFHETEHSRAPSGYPSVGGSTTPGQAATWQVANGKRAHFTPPYKVGWLFFSIVSCHPSLRFVDCGCNLLTDLLRVGLQHQAHVGNLAGDHVGVVRRLPHPMELLRVILPKTL